MSVPGDIKIVWSQIQATIQCINKIIDVLNDHDKKIISAVYYSE